MSALQDGPAAEPGVDTEAHQGPRGRQSFALGLAGKDQRIVAGSTADGERGALRARLLSSLERCELKSKCATLTTTTTMATRRSR